MSMFWIICIFVITDEFQPFSDGLFMWTAPPPAWNQTNPGNNPADIQTAVFRVLKGTTNYQVRWNYSLLEGQWLMITTFSIRLPGSSHFDDIGDVFGGRLSVYDKDGYRTRFKLNSTSEYSTLTITNVTERENATYQCMIDVGVNTWAYNVRIEVTDEPSVTNQQCPPSPVTEGDNVTLYCNATGIPAPNITWIRASTRDVLSNDKMHVITNIKRNESDSYECHASNGIGKNSIKSCTLDVQYRPKIVNLPREYNVAAQQGVNLSCQAEGNPTPSFTWTPCKDGCNKSTLVISEVLNDTVYTCKVANYLGNESASTSIVIAGKEINITLTITGESCTNEQFNKALLSSKLTKEIDKIFVHESVYNSTTLKDVRCGSLIVDLILKFNSIVSEKWVLNILKEATKNGKLGTFNVSAASIERTRSVISTTTSPPTGKTTPRSSDGNMIWIVGAVLGGLGGIVVIAIIVWLWWRKRRTSDDHEVDGKSGESHKMLPV